ncbi:hypothetical protein ACH41H_47450 [Streptomyces sp. NPDC020800]|uniref:hypothetical protein n=1 Tax=Streptomyces sp. NPDC020800 TaxID=3365092 RepID=UPI0037928FB5
MAEQIKRLVVPVRVEFYGWALQDWDDDYVPDTFPDGFEAGEFLMPHAGRLDFTSAGHTHRADVTVEEWDAEPPTPSSPAVSGDWDEVDEATIRCASGKLRAWSMGGPMTDDMEIELSRKPATWAVRAMCAGRKEVAELAQHSVPHDVECYVIQFWPAAP